MIVYIKITCFDIVKSNKEQIIPAATAILLINCFELMIKLSLSEQMFKLSPLVLISVGMASRSSTASLKRQLLREQSATNHDAELLQALFQARSSDHGVMAFLSYVTRYMQLHNMALPIHFAPDHPVEEAGRCVSYSIII